MRKLILLITILIFPIFCFAGQYGPTTSADQLWQIAVVKRPNAEVSIQQTMVAILKANPAAFVGNNVNGLKPNVTLQIPTLAVMQQIDASRAAQLIQQQDQQWSTTYAKSKYFKKAMDPAVLASHGYAKTSKPRNDAKKLPKAVSKLLIAVQTQQQTTQQEITNLQTQYSNIGKALINFDQQFQVRLADLEQHNLALQTEIDQVKQQLTGIKTTIASQHKTSKLAQFFAPYVAYLQNILGATGVKILLALIIVLILLLLWWICPCRRRRAAACKVAKDQEAIDDEAEYDFLGSEEGIPAKLDLARAYIDMGDIDAARKVLTEIVEQGTEEQQVEARTLLEQCGSHGSRGQAAE